MCVMPKANEVRRDCIYFRTWDGKKTGKGREKNPNLAFCFRSREQRHDFRLIFLITLFPITN